MREWRDIKWAGGKYQVSNDGLVRSVQRTIKRKGEHGNEVKYKGKILSCQKNSMGYYRALICCGGERKRYFVHRLVAEAFIPNPNNYEVVNHMDFNVTNNNVENLEWCTRLDNMRYSARNGRMKYTDKRLENHREIMREKLSTPIIGTDVKDGSTVIYPILNFCAKDGYQPSCVSNCCHGKRKTHAGKTWRFMTEKERSLLIDKWEPVKA